MRTPRLCFSLMLSVSPLIGLEALAGSATIVSEDGESSTFEYSKQALRITIPGQDSGYALVRDGSIYTVMQQEGRTLVIDAGSAMKGMGAGATSAVPGQLNSEVGSLDKTGRTEVVAGIKGDVYLLHFVDENGKEQTEEMVLSDDPRALEFRDGLFLMIEVAAGLTANGTADDSKSIQKALAEIDSGILRYGQDLTVTKIDGGAVDAARFELPAEPMDMGNIGALLGSMSQQAPAQSTSDDSETETGLFGSVMGAIGDKVNRQTDRLGNSAEQEIDAETDEKVDGALGKAFGKLFGR